MTAGPWFVRFAGRVSGPFDADRLRMLARRGSLTRLHAVSMDRRRWTPALSLRAVFNPDGTVVQSPATGTDAATDDGEPLEMDLGAPTWPEGMEPGVAPAPVSPRRVGSASVRPVVMLALAMAVIMLCLPTSRDDSGALAWWWSQGPLDAAVRGLSAGLVLVTATFAFMAPEPARSASLASVAAVLSAVGAASLARWAPAAAVIAGIVPLAAILVALDAAGSSTARLMGRFAMAAAVVLGASALTLGILRPQPWMAGSTASGVLGALSLAVAGFHASRRSAAVPGRIFWACVLASVAGMASLFATAVGALGGDEPMQAADASVAACLVLSFAAVSWACVHEAVETMHVLSADRGTSPAVAGAVAGEPSEPPHA